jgi:hypothetical protein
MRASIRVLESYKLRILVSSSESLASDVRNAFPATLSAADIYKCYYHAVYAIFSLCGMVKPASGKHGYLLHVLPVQWSVVFLILLLHPAKDHHIQAGR